MKQHVYRITVEHVTAADGSPVTAPPLTFKATCHDEVLGLIANVQARRGGDPDAAAAFALGLKLFGEAMLLDRDNPLYAEIRPHFGAFMKKLKSGGRPD